MIALTSSLWFFHLSRVFAQRLACTLCANGASTSLKKISRWPSPRWCKRIPRRTCPSKSSGSDLLYPFYFESNGLILDETSSHSLGKQSTKNQKQKFRKLTIIQIHWKNMAVIPKAFFFHFHFIRLNISGLVPRLKLLKLSSPTHVVITYFLLILYWLSDILDRRSDVPMDFPNARYANTKRSECAK